MQKQSIPPITWKEAREVFEKNFFTVALIHNKGNVTATARAVGIYRTEVYACIKRHNINVEAIKIGYLKDLATPTPDVRWTTVNHKERAIYAKYAKFAEFADYAEYAEFAGFADQERTPGPFLKAVREGIK
jgi:hypothetical protein